MAKLNILYASEMGNAIGIADNKSYFNFCGAGKKVDARMAELFANRILKGRIVTVDLSAQTSGLN